MIGGGPCTYNPEPIADFFDLFYIGEGETQYRRLLDLYEECKELRLGRKEFLRRAARIPGIYAPGFYEVTYHEDGTIRSFTPTEEGIPATIRKEIEMDVSDTYYPMKPVVPFIKVTQDRVVLEIQRGCIRGCRFCQAGQLYRPVRERDVETLKQWAIQMLQNTGHEEISLSSLSSSDYSKLPELINFLMEECKRKHTNISLPSLRIDAFSLDVMSKVQDVKKSSLTFAPEAGSQRLRNVINKGLTGEKSVRIDNGAFSFFYEKDKKSNGISYIAAFDTAYGFKIGDSLLDVKNSLAEYKYTEEPADGDNTFFLMGIENGTVLKYSFDNADVIFIFQDSELFAAALYSTENWII